MKLCSIAWYVLIFSSLSMLIDILLIGSDAFRFIINLLSVVLFVYITNWACNSQCCIWLAWIIVVLTTLNLLMLFFAATNKNNPVIKQAISEEKATMKK